MIDGGLRAIFRKYLPKVHIVTIESGFTEQGIPDLNFCRNRVEGWVECKKTSGWTVNLRPEQIGWLLRRRRCGGNCYVAVRRMVKETKRLTAADELWLFDGAYAAELKAHGLRGVKPLLQSPNGPSRWDWDAVAKVLGVA
jgi:hypothetical protein